MTDLDSIDVLVKSVQKISQDKLKSLTSKLGVLTSNLRNVGDPEKIHNYIKLIQSINTSISYLEEEIEDFSNSLVEEGSIEMLMIKHSNDKKFFDTIMPYAVLYSAATLR